MPNYSVLENFHFQNLHLDYMSHWEVALEQYMEVRNGNRSL